MATQQVKIKVNNKNQVKFNVQPQKIKFNINTNGRPGKDGEPPEFQIGTVSTLSAGESAKVEIDESSTKYNQILNFGIPQGTPGVDGYTPIKGVDYFDGDMGPQGPEGKQGLQGEDYVITEDDYAAIVSRTLDQVNPVLETNLEESKSYADSITPTKTSELINDSNFATINQNNNFSTSQTINGTLTVNGDIVQNGENYVTHAEEVRTKNDEIITREGAVGGLNKGAYSGIIAQKYDGENDGRLGFNADGEARVGDVGDEQPLLTRDEIVNLQAGQVLVWDGTNLRAVGSSEYVKNTDWATDATAGIVRVSGNYGIAIRTNQILQIAAASEAMIDAKTSPYRPIVPSNLDYAVGSVKASETQFGTIKVWTSENEDGEIGLNISTEG
jgi:hypothetical protein